MAPLRVICNAGRSLGLRHLELLTYLLADCEVHLVCAFRHCRYSMTARVSITPGAVHSTCFPMPHKRSDLDQAVRYLQHARELLETEPGARMRVIREVLRLAMRRLSPGDFYAGPAADEITLLRDIAGKVVGEVRTNILKAVAILADRGLR